MVFDGASNALGNGIGVVIVSPEGFHTPFTARLCFDYTNKMVGVKILKNMGGQILGYNSARKA